MTLKNILHFPLTSPVVDVNVYVSVLCSYAVGSDTHSLRLSNFVCFIPVQDRQCTYKRNFEELSECVCNLKYPACKAHAPCYSAICGLSDCAIFLHIIS